jgi:hypothetical protein
MARTEPYYSGIFVVVSESVRLPPDYVEKRVDGGAKAVSIETSPGKAAPMGRTGL